MKKYFKFILVLGVSVLLLVIFQIFSPKEIDWSLSYSSEDKIPNGSYVLYKVLPEIFPESAVNPLYYPAYNILYLQQYEGSCYIFLNNEFKPDELDSRELLNFADKGNYVFISANYMNGHLFDTLKIKTGIDFSLSDSLEVIFMPDTQKKKDPYFIKKVKYPFRFTEYDTMNSEILGVNKNKDPNFIRTKHGKGYFYLSSVPEAFTNFTLLDTASAGYAYKILSCLPPDLEILWDEYYKINKSMIRTPLKYILSQESLKWAYYILIVSALTYIIFQGRRKQRIVPLIPPLKNTTLEFVNTIGRLYFQQKNHRNIAQKKINFFLDFIRTRYFVKTDELNAETIEKISLKSGVDKYEVKNIFIYISYIEICRSIKEEELQKINSLIESFYQKAGVYGPAK